MEDLDEGNRSGYSASLEVALWCWKTAQKTTVVRIGDQNAVASGDHGCAGRGDEYRSIASCEAVTIILIWWPEEG